MDIRHGNFSSKFRLSSRRSMAMGAVFIVTLVAAVFVDADALLKYLSVIGGSAGTSLEIGAILTAAAAAPLLAMGMSIADDEMHGRS